MTLDLLEQWIRWMGGLAAVLTLALIFWGIGLGLRQPAGRTSGRLLSLLRSPVFYLFTSLTYFTFCWLLWRPIPLALSESMRIAVLILGALLYFAGVGLVAWGRLALGRQYFVSTSQASQLFAGHRLVTSGPYALVRHPMYLGILLAGLGGILLFRTWTLVFFSLNFLGLLVRARREAQVLAAEFGEEWQGYCRKVPAYFPRIPMIRAGRKK
jgi:protein-S-isoprenylcysteine O-methyltransferase Ste14